MDNVEYTERLLAIQAAYNVPEDEILAILTIGLSEEVGEVQGLIKKSMRDKTQINRTDLKKELSDAQGYLTLVAHKYDISLEDIFETGIAKLEDRQRRGTLRGHGNDR